MSDTEASPYIVIHQTQAARDELLPVERFVKEGIPRKLLLRAIAKGIIPACGDREPLIRRSDVLALPDRLPRDRKNKAQDLEEGGCDE